MTPAGGRGFSALAALAAVAAVTACPAPARVPLVQNRFAEDATAGRPTAYRNGPITSESVAAFLSWRFAHQLADGTFVAEYNDTEADVLDELRTMGIDDLHELAAIVPPDFDQLGAGEFIIEDAANIPGLVRDFLMIQDPRRYFQKAWKQRWQSILPANVSALRAYVRDFGPFYDAQVLTPQEVTEAPRPVAPTPIGPRPVPVAAPRRP